MPQSLEVSWFHKVWMALSAAIVVVAGLAASPAAAAPRGSNADSYVLTTRENSMSTNLSIDEFVRIREKRSGDFLWFRRAGKAYLIEDPATLAQAQELFAALRVLEPEQEDLRRRQEALEAKERKLDRQQEDLEREMDRLTDDGDGDESMDTEAAPPTDAEQEEIERQLDELRSRQDALRPRQREIQDKDRELEVVERALDAREEKMEKEAEAKLWILIDGAVKKGLAQPTSIR